MQSDKIKKFMQLAGQPINIDPENAEDDRRCLGAQLLLSETLEYVIKGLGVELSVNGEKIDNPEGLEYQVNSKKVDKLEMLDGLADVAYTMYWNMVAFNQKLEEAFELVCDNNLEKFICHTNWKEEPRPLEREEWDLGLGVSWPEEVVSVEIIAVGSEHYAVGKDKNGKVRKPSTYKSVDLSALI